MIRSYRITIPLLAALSAAAFGQDTAQKVTFTSPAATAKNLLASLSKSTGVNFTTSPQTAGDVLLVDVKDVPLGELMKRIATAASAEWKQEGESFRLIRSQALQNQQEREYLEDRASKIRAEQQRLRDEVAKQKQLSPAEIKKSIEDQRKQQEEVLGSVREGRPVTRTISAQNGGPVNRLMLRLLANANATDLARLSAGTRTVLSSLPTPMQRPLPNGSAAILSDFTREYAAWLAAQPPQAAPDPNEPRVMFMGGGNLVPMQGGLGKVLLVLTRNPFMPDLQAELLVADQSGSVVGRSFQFLRLGDSPARPSAQPTPETPAASAGGSEKALEVAPSAREHAAFMNQAPQRGNIMISASPTSGGGPRGRTVEFRSTVEMTVAGGAGGGSGRTPRLPVNAEWSGKLLHPETYDPLSFSVSDLYTALARSRGENLVASLPDSVLIPLSGRSLQTVTPTQLLEMSKTAFDLKVESGDGWLAIAPKFPAYVRATRVDRDELSKLLNRVKADGRLSLDSLAQYASSRNDPAPNPGLDGRYISVLYPQAFTEFNQAISNWRMHQLYHSLSTVQRRDLAAGGVIAMGGLSSQQQALVSSLVYNDPGGPSFIQPEQQGAPQNVNRSQVMIAGENGGIMSFGSSGGKLSEERTEFLPSGLPASGQLTVQVYNQEAVYASNRDGSADPRFFNPESYGAYMGMAPNIVLTGSGAPPSIPTYDLFKPAQIQTMDFLFKLSPQAQMTRQLRDAWTLTGSSDVPYSQLSESFRQKADEAAARMKNASGKINVGGQPLVKPPL